jgi:hypothetical protein
MQRFNKDEGDLIYGRRSTKNINMTWNQQFYNGICFYYDRNNAKLRKLPVINYYVFV